MALGLVAAPALYFMKQKPAPQTSSVPKKSEVVSTKVETAPTPATPKCEPYIRDIVRGDSLWKIAKEEYGGRGYMYPVFLETNEIPNPNLILAGGTILIPCLCDLQPLVKKAVVKKIAPKTKVTKTVTSISTPVLVTKQTVVPCDPCEKPATPNVSLVESPRPPPAPAIVPTPAPTQTQSQNVIVNVPPAATSAPAPQPVSQPAPPAQALPIPSLPTGFLATPNICGTGQISFSWNVTPGANTHKIYRDGVLVKETELLGWTDIGLVASQGYIYTIVASNAVGDSPVRWTTPPVTKAPEVCPVPPVKPAVTEVKPPVLAPQPKLLAWSLWNTIGQNPIEPGDTVDMVHGDIGIIIGRIKKFQFEPFMSFDIVKDFPKGYSWNNRGIGKVGGKIVRPVSHGVVEFGIAYAVERRLGNAGLPAQTKTGAILFTNGWFGGDQPTRHASKRTFLTGAFPRTFQWWAGNLSPFEKNKGDRFGNFMGTVKFNQGFTLAKVGGVSIIPDGLAQFGFDTYKNPWNNRYTYGGGLKLAFPWKSGVMDIQGGYYCATQYVGTPVAGGSRCGPGFSWNIWTGGRKKLGGS